MKAWAEFYPWVLTDVIGCPKPVIDHALREAAREFCLESKAWQETEENPAPGAINRFDFETSTYNEVIQVVRASVAGESLDVFGINKLPSDWETRRPCRNDALYQLNDFEYLLIPTPSAGQLVSITLALRPGPEGEGVGDDVFSKHVEAIAAGAKYRLLKMPRQPWTDLEQAALFKSEFDAGMHVAANRGFMHTSPSARRVKHWG
jgi:hypothetical protein